MSTQPSPQSNKFVVGDDSPCYQFLAALAALYLTLVSQSVSESVIATFKFGHKE